MFNGDTREPEPCRNHGIRRGGRSVVFLCQHGHVLESVPLGEWAGSRIEAEMGEFAARRLRADAAADSFLGEWP